MCGDGLRSGYWREGPVISPSTRAEHLLIHRIQSHTNPKRRKGFLKQAGQKSFKEELPKQRKGPKRAVKCRLKVPTNIWEQDAGSSSLPTRTKTRQNRTILMGFSSFLAEFIGKYWRVSGGLIVFLKAKNEQGVFQPCPYCRYLIFSSAIYAILLSINLPNAKIHQINVTATISFITIPTLVLDR